MLLELGYSVLEQSKTQYNLTKTFSNEMLQQLHSIFGEPFTKSLDLLDNSKVVQYSLPDHSRSVFKLFTKKDQFTIFHNKNFCLCKFFLEDVLENRREITCPHVLTVQIAQITCKITDKTISKAQLVDFLNEQLHNGQ